MGKILSHVDAPPENQDQIDCRCWWTKAQPHIRRDWGRDKLGSFFTEESRMLYMAWLAARDKSDDLGDGVSDIEPW